MRKFFSLATLILLAGNVFAAPTWDLLDKSMAAWNVNGGSSINTAWNKTVASQGNLPTNIVTQEVGYVNIAKPQTYHSYKYVFLTPVPLTLKTNTAYSIEVKARMQAIDKTTYPDIAPPAQGDNKEGGFESNQISARLNGKNLAIHIKHGDANTGYLTVDADVNPEMSSRYKLNTSEWHTYRFVLHADNLSYDVYIDDMDQPIYENVPTSSMAGTNILRLGAESQHRCNMDIEYVKMGTGDFYSNSKISSVTIASDSHVANNERTISVTANTVLIENGAKLLLSLANKDGVDVVNPIEITVTDSKAVSNFTIPASIPVGRYVVKVSAPDGKMNDITINPKTIEYTVTDVSPLETKMLPQVKPVGFVIDIDDYKYKGPSNEFIFPAIIDAAKYATNGKFVNGQDTLARYYRYYTPHENPGGMYLATAPTLDGPWTERNTVIDLAWAKAVPNNVINKADHVSACQVVWNDIENKFFMYFHGPNTTSHYATSDNLIDWTFGATVFTSNQFSSGAVEASYAKVFEHEIPGLGNKYVTMLMIMQGNMRKIYWAHSTDGINWTVVKKPLISPDINYKTIPGTDIKPDYAGSFGNNVAGPFLLEKDGRYFVIVNASSGHLFVIEVGESFDQEIHWGAYMKASDVIIDTDSKGNPVAVPRIAAPVFIKNDEGKWYMFFEAGGRLGANIALAKEETTPSSIGDQTGEDSGISIYPTVIKRGELLSVDLQELEGASLDIYDISGRKLSTSSLNNATNKVEIPFPAGMYLLKVSAKGNLVKEAKIIVTN